MHDNSLYIASVVNFLAVVGILVYFGRKPFADFLAARSQSIQTQMGEAEAVSREAGAQLAKWQSSWDGREAYVRQQWEEAKAALVNQKEKELKQAKAEAERIEKDADLMGGSEITRARKLLQEELVEKSVATAEEYFGENLSNKEREKLVSEYMDLVSNGKR